MVESANTTYMTGDSIDRKVTGFFLLGVVFLSIESAQLVGFDTTHLKVKMPTNEIVCPDDSLWFWPMPYYSFRQYFDSCYIDCTIGETRIYRQNGGSDRIAPCEYFFHVDSPTPKCFDTYDNLFDSSRTEYFSLNQGDTLRYYKSLSLVRKYMSTEYFGCSDTIFFLTQLLDSVSGNAIATIDTMAVIIADSLRTSAFYYCSTYTPTVGNVWSYVRPSDWPYDRVALSVSIDFRKAPGTEDILCRWDLFSDALFSGEDVYQFQTLCAIYDSIEAGGMGKIRSGFELPDTYDLSVWPNPSRGSVITIQFRNVHSSNNQLLIFDMEGKLVWKSPAFRNLGGAANSFTATLDEQAARKYFLIPVIDGEIKVGKVITLIK